MLKTSPTGKTDTRLALRVGVFYTNHGIVRNHSCPPHERARAGLPGVLTAQPCSAALPAARAASLAPGAPSRATAALPGSLRAGAGRLPGHPNSACTHTQASAWHFAPGSFYWRAPRSTASTRACRANLQLSTCTAPWLAQLFRCWARSLSRPALCPVVLLQHMQNSLGLPGEKTHNEPLLKLV